MKLLLLLAGGIWGSTFLLQAAEPSSSYVTPVNTFIGSDPASWDGVVGRVVGWNSKKFAPQGITIDLGNYYQINHIKFVVDQWPAGNTTHKIFVSHNGKDWRMEAFFTRYTYSGQVIDYYFFGGYVPLVRYVHVATISSPSWVAWKEIAVYGKWYPFVPAP